MRKSGVRTAFSLLGSVFVSALVLTVAPSASATTTSTTTSTTSATGAETGESPPEQPRGLLEILESWFPFFGGDDKSNVDPNATDDAFGGTPDVFGSTPLSLDQHLSEDDLKRALPWQEPQFGNQEGALGWNPEIFSSPPGFKERVNFWRDIYGKYTTSQGVIHDTIFVEIVYAPVDFTGIMKDPSRTSFQKARDRERMIDSLRSETIDRLNRLSQMSSPQGLTGEDLRVWKMFEPIKDPDKFRAAAEKGRVRFQLGQRDRFQLGIYYSGRYLREMERIFRQEGLPIELTRLPFVESSFNVKARSKVGASGIWQFMPRTAKAYMKVSPDVDERNDPLTATRASARLLKENYLMLQAWPLAITGYNHGPYGVRGIVNKLGTRDLVEIINRYSSRTFGFASENFYACFLAALEAERDARKYFNDVRWSPEIEGREQKVTRPVSWKSLLHFFDGDAPTATLLNPHFTSRVREGKASIPVGTFIRVPVARFSLAESYMKDRSKNAEKKLIAALASVPMPKSPFSADSALNAAEASIRARLSQQSQVGEVVIPALIATDTSLEADVSTVVPTIVNETGIEPGMEKSAAEKLRAREVIAPREPLLKERTHKVRRGETLFRIALTYGLTLDELKKLNGLDSESERVRLGQVLKLPDAQPPTSVQPAAMVPGSLPGMDKTTEP